MRRRRKPGQKPPGLYVHSSPPKGVASEPPPPMVRQWLRAGAIDRLEALVLQGQGHRLLGEYSPDIKVRAFLKAVPAFLARIDMVHEAAGRGSLADLQALLQTGGDSHLPRRRLGELALSRDASGAGLLHKAVCRGHKHVVRWLLDYYPKTVHVVDKEGRSPLHYAGRAPDADWMWSALRQAGADSALLDSAGRSPAYYMDRPQEALMPPSTVATNSRFAAPDPGDIVVKPSNIRIWIHDQDLGRLQRVVWEGHGDKLRTETSQNPVVKQFLASVPRVMGVIKDVHWAAVNNDLRLLKRRTNSVPKQIWLAKDANGLTPLHKAAGLGHDEIVRTILAACPEAVSGVDRDGRTALHYAAAARGSGATYDALLDYQANEAVLDKRGKPAMYYAQNTKELDQKLLSVVPEAPRVAGPTPSTDWRMLWGTSTNSDSAFEDETTSKSSPPATAPLEIPVTRGVDESTRPQTYDLDADEGVKEIEEKERGYNADTDEQEGHYEAEYAEVSDYGLMNEPTKKDLTETKPLVHLTMNNPTAEVKRQDDGCTPDGRTGPREENIKRLVESGDMEQLAALVLAGSGKALLAHRSADPDVQRFLNNLPIYISKIDRVHKSTREGNLRELQSALDRRKFALAQESVSPLKLTPLHLAVLYGRTSVLKFLSSKFPETLLAVDANGRTPLHYAATLPDNQHYYNLLISYGADNTIKDLNGKTASDYLSQPGQLTHQNLLAQYEDKTPKEVTQHPAANSLSDKGLAESAVVATGFPVFGQEEGRYLASSLGQPLVQGLTEVVSKRPNNPVRYLADYLYSYEDDPDTQHKPKVLEETYVVEKEHELKSPPVQLQPSPPPRHPPPSVLYPSSPRQASLKELEPEEKKEPEVEVITPPESIPSAFKSVQRDEYGQMVAHFAMARSHGRNALFQLLQDVDCNIALRDELYRTPRDVAQQLGLDDNIASMDKYLVSLGAIGEVDKLRELLLEGYDHILDSQDEGVSIMEAAARRNQSEVVTFLESINFFEESRERLHRAVRDGSEGAVELTLRDHPGLAVAHDRHGRTSLHLAVLAQHKRVVQLIASRHPQTLTLGDNLLRTPLHYAMGVEEVESLSKILIQAGATRVIKDLKGRQPSYYFMNKSDIQRLQEEEERQSV